MVLSQTPTRHDLIFKSTDGILAAADAAEPKIRRAMLDALDALQDTVPDLERLIASGDMRAVFDALPKTLPKALTDSIADATATAAIQSMTPEAATFGVAFNQPNEQAIRWAQANAAQQVSGITTASRVVVEEIVEEMIMRGIHPRIVARQIENVVPLLPQHAKSVSRLFQSSLDAGVSLSHAEKIAARKTKKLLRYRAEMIARTEAIKASNMGQQILWEQAVDLGLLPAGTKKIWVATGDDRTCPICAVMDGQTVEIVTSPGTAGRFDVTRQATGFVRSGSTFRVNGTKPYKGGGKMQTPPAHPQCRCTMIMETIEAPGQTTPTPAAPTILSNEQWDIMKPTGGVTTNRRGSIDRAAANRTAFLAEGGDDAKAITSWLDLWEGGAPSTLRNHMNTVLAGEVADTPNLKRADLMLRTIRESPIDPPDELLRGMKLEGSIDDVVAKFTPGSEVDWGLSSFTSDIDVADNFAFAAPGETSVKVAWVGDKQALPLQEMVRHNEAEWIAGGRFKVVDVTVEGRAVSVKVEQVAGL